MLTFKLLMQGDPLIVEYYKIAKNIISPLLLQHKKEVLENNIIYNPIPNNLLKKVLERFKIHSFFNLLSIKEIEELFVINMLIFYSENWANPTENEIKLIKSVYASFEACYLPVNIKRLNKRIYLFLGMDAYEK